MGSAVDPAFAGIPHVGLTPHTTTDESSGRGGKDCGAVAPLRGSRLRGNDGRGRGCLFSKQSPMLASSNTTTNENRRADADTWIPAFVGIPHVGLTPHTTTDESSGQGGPLSNSPPQTVERTFEAMTGGAWGGIAVLSPRYEVPACAGMTEGGAGAYFRSNPSCWPRPTPQPTKIGGQTPIPGFPLSRE